MTGWDPAAVPLGTDDEAAGAAPSQAELDRTHRHEAIGRSGHAPQESSWTLPIVLAVAFVLTAGALVVLISTV